MGAPTPPPSLSPAQPPTAPAQKEMLELWKQAIATQMHFNDLCVRSRQLGLTFVVGALGLTVVLLSNFPDARIYLGDWNAHISSFVTAIAAAAVLAVWHLDLGVYHKMLRGSVAFAEQFDKAGFSKNFAGMPHGMTEFISIYSRKKDVKYDPVTGFQYKDAWSAGDKVRLFYIVIFVALVAIAALLAIAI